MRIWQDMVGPAGAVEAETLHQQADHAVVKPLGLVNTYAMPSGGKTQTLTDKMLAYRQNANG